MAYKKVKSHKLNVEELRKIWKDEYCSQPIITFDNIEVKFYEDMFDHAFFESQQNKPGDKSILSLNRLEKIFWIKDTLQDKSALLKQGWDKHKKKYVPNRRINFVKGNYIVVLSINKQATKARFITAYEIQNKEKIKNINNAPDWKRQ